MTDSPLYAAAQGYQNARQAVQKAFQSLAASALFNAPVKETPDEPAT